MSDLLELLRESRGILLGLRDKALSRNNMETLAAELIPDIEAEIAELEAAPERKCGTCRDWQKQLHDYGKYGSCDSALALSKLGQRAFITKPEFGCADWQPKEQK